MLSSINYSVCTRTDPNSRCFTDASGKRERRDFAAAAANLQVGSRGVRACTWNLVLVKVSKVNRLCAKYAHLRGYTPHKGGERGSRERRGSLSGTLFLFLQGTSAHLPMFPLVPLPCPLRVFVPLNKLVRFNDSYFFLVTRLPSFAPTRRLRKVVVNLVPSTLSLSLSLSISAAGDHRDSGLTTVGLSASSFRRWN